MYNTRILKKTIAGALLSGGVAVTGVGLTIGIAQADPFAAQPHPWCPGQGLPFRNTQPRSLPLHLRRHRHPRTRSAPLAAA
jgi:hypothetical protein